MIGLLVVIGAFLVLLLTSLFKHVNWSSKVKNLLAMVISLIVGLGSALLNAGSIDALADNPGGIVGVVGVIYLASQVVYEFILKGSRAEDFLAEKELV